jgi:hypothetical protein
MKLGGKEGEKWALALRALGGDAWGGLGREIKGLAKGRNSKTAG